MSVDKEKKVINLNIRVTEATKKGLDKLAEKDRRTVSDYIRIQLENMVANSSKK
jgi:mRNA-degrading endonuclease RelE of RelBE toxin-antitoxin system